MIPGISHVSHFVGADNLYFIGNMRHEMETMFVEFTAVLSVHFMDWMSKPKSLEFVHTCATDSFANLHATVDGLEYTVKHKTLNDQY